ncbi:MAG: PHP-associated domain-containing protein [Desulfarculaceae bacterium]|jgi:hypothetical protein
MNNPGTSANQAAQERTAALGIKASAGSDAHIARDVGRFFTEFALEIRTEAQLVQAWRSGKYIPRSRPT